METSHQRIVGPERGAEAKPEVTADSRPRVNLVGVRYSDAFLRSLKLWHRPDQGSIVVQIDPFTPRFPLEALFSLGHGNTPSGMRPFLGPLKKLELEARTWLTAASIHDIIIPDAERLRDSDLETLGRVVPDGVRVWLLHQVRNRKKLEVLVWQVGWQISPVRSLNPRHKGSPIRRAPDQEKKPIRPKSRAIFLDHLRNYSELVFRGSEKVERAIPFGLLDMKRSAFVRWITLAGSDPNGQPCPFRLMGVVLKLAALGRLVEVAAGQSQAPLPSISEIGNWSDGRRSPERVLIDQLWSTGMSRAEAVAIDTGQIAGCKRIVLVAGTPFTGQLAVRIHSRQLEACQSGMYPWLVLEPREALWTDPKGSSRIAVRPFSISEPDRDRRLVNPVTPSFAQLEVLTKLALRGLDGGVLSRQKASQLAPDQAEALSTLVDCGPVRRRENRYEIHPHFEDISYRALRYVKT